MDVSIRAFELKKRVDKAVSSPTAMILPREFRELIAEIGTVLAEVSKEVIDLRGRRDDFGR